MPKTRPPQQWPERSHNDQLHEAIANVSIDRAVTLLSIGGIDIEHESEGFTPLMAAAGKGSRGLVRILLNNGASASKKSSVDESTALHLAAIYGHDAEVIEMLVKAGANIDEVDRHGRTALHHAAANGYSEVMRVLIKIGANINSRSPGDGETPLQAAAMNGQLGAVRVLLASKANPRLKLNGIKYAAGPLEGAAQEGHSEVVREMLQQVGIEGCGGPTVGVAALYEAAKNQHVDIMAILTDAGVVDTGTALVGAAACGREASTRFLLRQQEKRRTADRRAYLNSACVISGATPMVYGIGFGRYCDSRIVRLLVDAGADTASVVHLTGPWGQACFSGTPLDFANDALRGKMIAGQPATEEQLRRLEAIRRLLSRVEAVQAVSWLWLRNYYGIGHAESYERGHEASSRIGTQLKEMLPILRRRARRRSVLCAALFRHSSKP